MSRAKKLFDVTQLNEMEPKAAIRAIGQMLDALFESVNSVRISAPVHNERVGQLDAVWFVIQLGAAGTNQTFGHALGRVPVGALAAHPPFQSFPFRVGGSLGQITIQSLTQTTITLQTDTSNKYVALILF